MVRDFFKNHKKLALIIGVPLVLIVALAAFVLWPTVEAVKPSVLESYEGDVRILRDGQYVKPSAGMKLGLNDKIETQAGNAVVKLYDKAEVVLRSNTKVRIRSLKKDDLKIEQIIGNTWNKFTKTMQTDSYQVETPNTVASVRGTEYKVTVFENGSESVSVAEGEVNVKTDKDETLLQKHEKANIGKEKRIEKSKVSEKELNDLLEVKKARVNRLKQDRLDIVNRNTVLLKIAETTHGFSKQEILQYFEKMDSGEVNGDEVLDKAISKAPVKKAELRKIKDINKVIRNEKSEINEIQSQLK